MFVGALVLAFGWQTVLFVELPIVILAGGVGIWLFYVQHQFDDTYWERTDEWSFEEAAVRGSSHMALPKVLQFFSGNIGFHHVHHLNAKIPHYNLPRAHEEQAMFTVAAERVVHRRPARGAAQAVGRTGSADGHLEAGEGDPRQLTGGSEFRPSARLRR